MALTELNAANSGMGQAQFGVTAGGMRGMGMGYDSQGGFDGRTLAQNALKVGGAVASGFAAFSHAASAGGPAGAIAGTCLGAVAEAMQGAFSAYDAQKTIAKLSQLFDDAERNNEPGLAGVIAGCMGKAKNKRAYGVANATIAGQPGVMVVRGVRAVGKAIKGRKGVGRADRTEALYEFATKGNNVQKGIAQEAIHAICAAKFEDFMKKSIADAMKS